MTLCHEGLEIVKGVCGGGERRQATQRSQPLAEAVERQVMHTNGHRQACQTNPVEHTTYFKNLLLNPSRNSKGREEGREGEAGEKRRY